MKLTEEMLKLIPDRIPYPFYDAPWWLDYSRWVRAELKNTADETLFLELALRGYDLSKLRDEPTTAEIVKIG